MQENTYSRGIADTIGKYLTRTRCKFSFDDKRGRFRFSAHPSGTIGKIDYTVCVRKEQYAVYAAPSICVNANDREMMAALAEFICRTNYGLVNGNFELGMNDGEIRYKCFVNCSDNALTAETVEESICVPAGMLNRYADGISDVIFGYATPEEAVARCERLSGKKADRPIPQWTDVGDSGEYERMAARLRKRLGVSEGEASKNAVSKKASWDTEMPKHIRTDLFGTKGGGVS